MPSRSGVILGIFQPVLDALAGAFGRRTRPAVVTVPVGPAYGRPGQTQFLGINASSDVPNHVAYTEAWLGAPVDIALGFLAYGAWADMRSSSVSDPAAHPPGAGRRRHYAMPLTVGSGTTPTTTLAQVAGGSNDADFSYAAQNLAAAQPSGDILLRLGHEMNGPYYPWYAYGHEADYIAAFQRVVPLIRAASSRFKIVWCPNNTVYNNATPKTAIDPSTMYPGDVYVDIIGMDVYWSSAYDGTDPVATYNNRRNAAVFGFDWAAQFATAHGKGLSIPEWGVNSDIYAQTVTLFAGWLATNNVLFHDYWDSVSSTNDQLSNNQFPNAGAAFIKAFGLPSFTSAASQTAEVGTALSIPLTIAHGAAIALTSADVGLTLAGSNLNAASQSSTGTLHATVQAVDTRGLVATQGVTVSVVGAYGFINAEAFSYAGAMTAAPNRTFKQAIDAFFTSIKSASILTLCDAIMLPQMTAQAMLLNAVSRTAGDFTVVGGASPTFAPGRSFKYASGGGHIEGVLSTRSGSKFVRDSATLAVWEFSELDSNTGALGVQPSATIKPKASGLVKSSLNDYTNVSVATGSSTGLTAASRSSSATGVQLYRNGSQIASNTQTSGTGPSGALTLFGPGNGYYDAHELGFVFVGANLTASQHSSLYTAVLAYLQAVGAT